MKLRGKKALITGGNSGIGLATARFFIVEGAQVAITGRDHKTLDQAIAELGSSARGYRSDFTGAEDRKQVFAALANDFGKLDIIFNLCQRRDLRPDDYWFDRPSHFFNGSVHNYLGQPGQAAYAATKSDLVSMARSIAADLAPRNIRVNVIAPGATKTPIWNRGARASVSADESAKLAKSVSSAIPLGRWREPEEFAKAVLFLASDDSSYGNAVELMVDGEVTGAPFGAPILRN